MTDTSMRERLARVLCVEVCSICKSGFCSMWDGDKRQWEDDRVKHLNGIDAILAALKQPTEGMVLACIAEGERQHVAFDEMSPPLYFAPIIAAAIQHIQEGGK